MSNKENLVTMEEAQALSREIGSTISRLLAVLKANQVINDADIEYVQGKITVEELQSRKKHEIKDFLDLLFSKPNTDEANEKDT